MDEKTLIEAAEIINAALDEGVTFSIAGNAKEFKSLSGKRGNTSDHIKLYVRSKNEGRYKHGPSIKVGRTPSDFSPITFPGCEIKSSEGSFGTKREEKDAIKAAQRFVMDNVMILIAFWNETNADVKKVLADIISKKLSVEAYYKNDIVARKSSEEEAKDREDLTNEVRSALNDSSIALDFELADKFNEKKKLKKQMKKKRRG